MPVGGGFSPAYGGGKAFNQQFINNELFSVLLCGVEIFCGVQWQEKEFLNEKQV